jgi:hypothetical protein
MFADIVTALVTVYLPFIYLWMVGFLVLTIFLAVLAMTMMISRRWISNKL